MGRRKIEILPIQHERNRSVTFLKRKNGLFKKAYELGVLCSVDVAVIIFEERQGHHVKCYEYCSGEGDIRKIVDRHVRFDGERDTRTPVDFGNNKAMEVGDDDEGDDDDDLGHGGVKRRSTGQINQIKKTIPMRSNTDPSLGLDDYRSMTIPAAPFQLASVGGGPTSSSLPLSVERHAPVSNHHPVNKKPRLAPSTSLSDDRHGHLQNGGFPSYRLDGDSEADSSYRLPSYPTQPSHMSQHFPPVFPPTNNQGPLFDFTRVTAPQQNVRSVGFPSSSTGGLFPQSNGQQQPGQRHGMPQTHDQLASFLDQGSQGHRGNSQFAPFDWPVHAPQQQQSQHQSSPPQQNGTHETSWLDFLGPAQTEIPSSSSPPTRVASASAYSHPPGEGGDNGRTSVSWERQRQASSVSASNSRPSSSLAVLVSPSQSANTINSLKRPRTDSDASPSQLKELEGLSDLDVTRGVLVNGNGHAYNGKVKSEGGSEHGAGE
ncbi:hypothetical protein JAAARDRAFT_30535 [Jaapia argillacea MUCL 33604]|uniref:MADS-box domain-containing protein n=1 Tax=Jaapia argillacea MUCL 33604 TaxID=933084 RepID=A0A067Q6M2_9AGAM|nr:hypothetical protein JAAARDRAFT_30535 [Jaapia argillacea MUCL 33604]